MGPAAESAASAKAFPPSGEPAGAPFRGPGVLVRVAPFAVVAALAEASLALPPGAQSAPAAIVSVVLLWASLGTLISVATHGLRDRIGRAGRPAAGRCRPPRTAHRHMLRMRRNLRMSSLPAIRATATAAAAATVAQVAMRFIAGPLFRPGADRCRTSYHQA